MEPVSATQMHTDEVSRRSLVRRAAYTAPAVFVIAAAPGTALGTSGPKRKDDKPKKNKPKKNK